ncbi:GbsR/MarR family transcriptional regulator [Actinomadura livida]|uniref:Biotin operon repressor n=1 Tax=Actinomadura livida TaxID=79909 RepID=A0A7W7IF77_9ACTN|nr:MULTISPECIES: MarR family transcriptional regulator [Actinomadura]MBB4775890.1 biotin operon repressor [Actinomadura catellatispora]GGU39175.1 transcriptional regulator [Actinomadura livida]
MEETSTGREEASVRRFVEHLAAALADFGFPPMSARVLVTMMVSDEETLSAADFGERLGASPGAISTAVRHLMHIGILVREPMAGSRSHRYRLTDDTWYEGSVSKAVYFKVIADLADEGVGVLGGTETQPGARMAEMRDFFRFFQNELTEIYKRWKDIQAGGADRPSPSPEA